MNFFNPKKFEKLVKLKQKDLKHFMRAFLDQYYTDIIETDEYIVAKGDLPIALVAHMDTVWPFPVKEFYFDYAHSVCWSPDGLGADDRAGIYAIMEIVPEFSPTIILTTDEEIGGKGAKALGSLPCPVEDLKFIIELDRQGEKDCVFYECGNKNFQTYIENFGFVTQEGLWSDISFFAENWNIAAVNLSVGYFDEHSESERLFGVYLMSTINKVKKILADKEAPYFDFQKRVRTCGVCHNAINSPVKYSISGVDICDACAAYFKSISSKGDKK